MAKNWLIRTRTNHILGPVSKEKVIELYNNGSIKSDDEICSGNGFWFFLRETDMVERFLTGTEVQNFNPMSEAKDVLTANHSGEREPTEDDITLIGMLNLSSLNEPKPEPSSKKESPVQEEPKAAVQPASSGQAIISKKKIKTDIRLKSSVTPRVKPQPRKQNYLIYILMLGLITVFFLIYFRKTLLPSYFKETSWIPSLIETANAQDTVPEKKKRLFEREVTIEKATFSPLINLDGLRVISSFDVDAFTCADLVSEVNQLAVLLYPTELFNEKFLLNVRNCMLNLDESHPVKRWLKHVSSPLKPDLLEQRRLDFAAEMLSSPFNLITDIKVKTKVIDLISNLPNDTLVEKIFSSYLYLMIGNISRSDLIIREIINQPPRKIFAGYGSVHSSFHKLADQNLDKMLNKLGRHPADRLSFHLLIMYFQNYMNSPDLLALIQDIDTSETMNKLTLRRVEKVAPGLVGYLRLKEMSRDRRLKKLTEQTEYPLDKQAQWSLPFILEEPPPSEAMSQILLGLEQTDPMWAIYLTDDERLADLYLKRGGSFTIAKKRQFLRQSLGSEEFMMSLLKLIELGDIDGDLIEKTANFLVR